MTIRTVNVATLKKVKNTVIGNPSAKSALAQDELFVATLVDCLNAPDHFDGPRGSQDDIRVEAAQIISSLSYGSPEALRSLLRADAHQAFLYAISRFDPSEPVALKSAFARALRTLASASAELVGPSQWGLKDDASAGRDDAKLALDYFFQVEVLDIYLPLLVDPSPQTSMSIAQLLGAALRTQNHRAAVAEWTPPADRSKEVRGRRRWEKPDTTVPGASGKQGGWAARTLTSLLRSRDSKVQEAALSALAALAKDNYEVAATLAKGIVDRSGVDSSSALSLALSLCKSRSTDVQLAASLCATHIIRASASNHHHPTPPDLASSLIVMHVMNRMIASPTESTQTRSKACFILNFLVMDEKELCQTAFDRGSLTKLATLVKSISPLEKATELDEDEPESLCCLREAALTAIAVLAIADDDTRRDITDNLRLIPILTAALAHPHTGVRYAACQCVRALSRSVAVARTSLVDSGLGSNLYQTFLKQDEDRRVTYAALTAVCNLVSEYSPLRQPFLDQGLVKRLSQLLRSGHAELRLNALWAIKNLVYRCSSGLKHSVVEEIGWKDLDRLLLDSDPGVQEQAFYIIRNFANCEEDIEMVFQEFGPEHLLDVLVLALESKNGDVVLQAAFTLSNLANGSTEYQEQILSHPRILKAVRSCLVDAPMEVRRAAVCCVLQLAGNNTWKLQKMHDAGIDSTLRHICEYTGTMSPSVASPHVMGLEREVKAKAREALNFIEHGPDMIVA
ncbi:ARM repeat-containing protein [Artomyces pyxidatus]|uniref:ARM repeat-containing protein n=1 Tax=Artomyces pyxidatus TaxID=48021 RepID=A0ACB8T7N0_9AGAM|nr:ARM repeat-containing protein [Artomyces pyxidatus]